MVVIDDSAKDAAPALIEALGDKNKRIRSNATWALGRLPLSGYPVTLALTEALGDKNKRICSNAAKILSKIGELAIPALIKALGDENEEVRSNAAKVLGRIGTPAAKRAIEQY